MSTISLMPIGKKLVLTKEYKLELSESYGSYLSDAKKTLLAAGLLAGNTLILDPGVKIRVDGFMSNVTNKNWPKTKVTINPPTGKQAQVYVTLSELDGLTWEADSEEVQVKVKKDVCRINVTIKPKDQVWVYGDKFPNWWHDAFPKRSYTPTDGEVSINPHALAEAEMTNRSFKARQDQEIGEAVVKKGKDSWSYKVTLEKIAKFNINLYDTKPGFMFAMLSEVRHRLTIKDDWYSSNDKKPLILTEDLQGYLVIEPMVYQHLALKHKIQS